MHHWRRGVVGAVLDWAEGSEADAAMLVFMLIEELKLQDVQREKLKPSQDTRGAETNTFIVDRIEKALAVLKSCATEQQRQDYLFALAQVAPPRLAKGDPAGMIKKISERLAVCRGKHKAKKGGQPYAFDKAISRRTDFDAEAARHGALFS
jgi:hypothetical protein